MGRLFSTLPLFSTDYSSAASAVRDSGALAIICCPNGCMGNYVRFDEPRWADMPGNVLQMDMEEIDVIFGSKDWMKELRGLDVSSVEAIAFVHTPVSSLVGFDTDSLCRKVREEFGVRAVSIATNGYGTYHDGMDKAMRALLKAIPEEGGTGGTAILGFTPLEYTEAELAHVKDSCRAEMCFPGDPLGDLSRVRGAERNVLISSSATPFARMMEKRFGIPYELYTEGGQADPIGDADVLIIGEQVRSNLIRNELRRKGRDADVATFFTLDDRFSEKGDLKLRTEEDVSRLGSEGYQYVIGDPLIEPLFPESVRFIRDPQAAISSRLFWNDRIDLFSIGSLAESVMRQS